MSLLPLRRRSLALLAATIALGLAPPPASGQAAAPAGASVTSAAPAAVRPLHEVGASLQDELGVKNGAPPVYALVIFYGTTGRNRALCDQFKDYYGDTLRRLAAYHSVIFVVRKAGYTEAEMRCDRFGEMYAASGVDAIIGSIAFEHGTRRGPFLMVVQQTAARGLINQGYMDLSDVSIDEAQDRFRQFDAYFAKGNCGWYANEEVSVSFVVASRIVRGLRSLMNPCK